MSEPKRPLDLEQMLTESQGMAGPLGALAYSVMKGLDVGGASKEAVAGVRVLMQEYFERLSDDECNALCDFVFARLKAHAASKKPWYP